MLSKLRKKWQVGKFQLLLIFVVFAITGTTTALLTRQITRWLDLEPNSFAYWLLKIGVLLIGYWFILLIVAIPFGQFPFFWGYIKRVNKRLTGRSNKDDAAG